jgi:hypothetical protein
MSLRAEAIKALEAGRMIEAVKIVRQETSLGLKESKDLVDAYLAANPHTRPVTKPLSAGQKTLGFLIVAGIVLALGFHFLVKR